VVGQGNPEIMVSGIANFHYPTSDIILSDMFNFDNIEISVDQFGR